MRYKLKQSEMVLIKIYSLSQTIVAKRLGKIRKTTFESVIAPLNRLIAPAG